MDHGSFSITVRGVQKPDMEKRCQIFYRSLRCLGCFETWSVTTFEEGGSFIVRPGLRSGESSAADPRVNVSNDTEFLT